MKSKSGRRPPVKVKSGPELPLLPIAVGGILVVLAVVLIIYSITNSQANKTPGCLRRQSEAAAARVQT